MGNDPAGLDIGVGGGFGEAFGLVVDGVEDRGFGFGHVRTYQKHLLTPSHPRHP